MREVEWTPDRIERELVRLEGVKAQVTAVQARLIDEADRMQLPLSDGCRSVNEWVAGRLDVSSQIASDLVCLARSGDVSDLESGVVSVERSLARRRLEAAGASKEAVEFSNGLDLSGVRRLAARHRRTSRHDQHQTFEGRHMAFQTSLDGAVTRFWGSLAGIDGPLVEARLTEVGDDLGDTPGYSRGQRNADALVKVCMGEAEESASGTPVAVVAVDARLAAPTDGEAGVTVVGGPTAGPQTLEEILCEGTIEVVAESTDGAAFGIGTAGKSIPPRIRRHVLARDGGCCADGCDSNYRLQAHHLKLPRSRGGTADPTNLASFCWFHHHIVIHGRGMIPNPNSPPGRIRFLFPP